MPSPPCRWFFRERPNDGLWLPFSAVESGKIEQAIERKHNRNILLREPEARFVQIDERRMHYASSGDFTQVLRGSWYYTRSDKLLQPFSEDVAERLTEAVQKARAAYADMKFWRFDLADGSGRSILGSLGGGFVQQSAFGTLRLVTRLYVTPNFSCSRAPVYAVFKSEKLQCAGSCKPLLGSLPSADSGPTLAKNIGLEESEGVAVENTIPTISPFRELPSVVSWWVHSPVCEELLDVPEGTGPQWFYSRDDRTWNPYSAPFNATLEKAQRHGLDYVQLVLEEAEARGPSDGTHAAASDRGSMNEARRDRPVDALSLPSVVTWWGVSPTDPCAHEAAPADVKYVVSIEEGWQVVVSDKTCGGTS